MAGAWIESHINLIRHHKVRRMSVQLDLKPAHVVGHLHSFWHAVMDLRPDGDITAWTPQEVAYYAQYEGDVNKFYDALLDGWLDKKNGMVLVHDWLDYGGRYLQAKLRSNKNDELEAIKKKHSQTEQSSYSTGHNSTGHNSTIIHSVFDYFCTKTGRNLKLTDQRKKLIAKRLKEGRTEDEIKTAIDNFAQDDWPDRHKYCDLVYCIGIRANVDNLDKWINKKKGDSYGFDYSKGLTGHRTKS